MPHAPKIAMEVWDKTRGKTGAAAAKAPFAGAPSDPAAWGKNA